VSTTCEPELTGERCRGPFANSLFFPKDGKAFCTECYESA
jgi:hypothetical protein